MNLTEYTHQEINWLRKRMFNWDLISDPDEIIAVHRSHKPSVVDIKNNVSRILWEILWPNWFFWKLKSKSK